MKAVVIAAFFLIFSISYAQENTANSKAEPYALTGSETYIFDSQIYTFTPELNSIKITRLDKKEEVDYGQLRRTTDDGLYIMTSNFNDEVSFGRFDSVGNFKTLRYDVKTDKVLEEYFQKKQQKARLSLKN